MQIRFNGILRIKQRSVRQRIGFGQEVSGFICFKFPPLPTAATRYNILIGDIPAYNNSLIRKNRSVLSLLIRGCFHIAKGNTLGMFQYITHGFQFKCKVLLLRCNILVIVLISDIFTHSLVTDHNHVKRIISGFQCKMKIQCSVYIAEC